MPWSYRRAAFFGLVILLGPVCRAFQLAAPDSPVSITPRLGRSAAKAASSNSPSDLRPSADLRLPTDLRIDSSLVLIPVNVTNPLGAPVRNLSKDNFRLFEDGIEQTITLFSQEDAPVSIGLLFDSSGSMSNKMHQSSEAAASFFKTANAEDEFFLVEFNERPRLTVAFTPDSNEIYRRIARVHPFGRTSLLDAIQMAMIQMKHARNERKAIVILSDGGDNRSRHTAREIKSTMSESDVQVYAMGIFDREDVPKHTPEEQNGPKLLDELAQQTGGQVYVVERDDDLASVSARIGNQLRNQYVLGYSPSNSGESQRDGKYRHVKLDLNAPTDMPDLRTYYRHGYFAPNE